MLALLSPCRRRDQAASYLTAVALVASPALFASPAHAIPSPELVVGSLSSLAQLIALATATLGGGAALAGARGRAASGNQRAAYRIAAIAAAIAMLATGLALYQWIDQRGERQARLEATLLRPATAGGAAIADPRLKEIVYRDQVLHSRGIPSDAAQAIVDGVASGTLADTVILDVREDAERVSGSLPGARGLRGADIAVSLDTHDGALAGRRVLFVCHNGNRSAELCEALAARGIDCRFLIGGLEKWIVEHRTMTGLQNRDLDSLRAIPDYPNRDRLLDTRAVHALVAADAPQFVDVRYPGEFARGHLPAAVNLPMRLLPRSELDTAIAALPKTPIITPCYDRRSCFFAEALGLELTRAGHDFRGRYTQPWEYFTQSSRPPHVEAWIAERNKSTWTRGAELVTEWLVALANTTGLPLALVLAALVSRILVAPFSLKAERDQLAARHGRAELEALKQRLAGDPVRLRRALAAFYRAHGLTPGRNLIALLLLPVMALTVDAAGRAATLLDQPFLIWPSLAERDATLLLPLAFGLAITLYVAATLAETRRHKLAAALLGVPLFTATAALLPAAAGIYLNASALLLLVQRALASGALARIGKTIAASLQRRPALPGGGFLALADVTTGSGLGNKAERLAVLARRGLPVPRGVVLRADAIRALDEATPAGSQRPLHRVARHLGGRRFAVRSSGGLEDGATQSFAGVFDTVLDVPRAELRAAVAKVAASFADARAASYAASGGEANILVQPMLAAEFAGVLFTRAPDAPGAALVELVEGNGEALVSGAATPRRFHLGRASGALLGAARPPIALAPLLALGRTAEQVFGRPQDIEWAYLRGRFHILQSRDITTGRADAADIDAALALGAPSDPDQAMLAQTPLSEVLPEPTALSLALQRALWAPGGSVDLACRRLGLAYGAVDGGPELLAVVNGRLYVANAEAARRAPRLTALSMRRIVRAAPALEQTVRDELLPALAVEMRLAAATDLDRLADADLTRHFARAFERLVHEIHPDVEMVNITADVLARQAPESSRAAAQSHATALATSLCVAAGLDPAARAARIRDALGHRAPVDYELALPRYAETPALLGEMAAILTPRALSAAPDGALDPATLARRYEVLKEDAKHEMLRVIAELRRTALAIDRRFSLDGRVFDLLPEDIAGLHTLTRARFAAKARAVGEARRSALARPLPPARMSLTDLERLGLPVVAPAGSTAGSGPRAGLRVAGNHVASGSAFLLGHDARAFADGDILVARMIGPEHLALMLRSGGVVTEVGGSLSHMAIVARERGIAMIVGATGLDAIAAGDHVTLGVDGTVTAEPAGRQPIAAAAE